MKFLVDAQLPVRLAEYLRNKGFDAIHTSELPNGNDTRDAEINRISLADERVVVTKDGDFYDSFTSRKEPYKLLHVKTGNTSNADLLALIERNWEAILDELDESDVVTVDQRYIIALH